VGVSDSLEVPQALSVRNVTAKQACQNIFLCRIRKTSMGNHYLLIITQMACRIRQAIRGRNLLIMDRW
jgi:hypothetical protein